MSDIIPADLEENCAVSNQMECKKYVTGSGSDVQHIVMPSVVGYISYDVRVRCPHCEKTLQLNQYPYDDNSTKYSLDEDEVGLALFGMTNEPAKWSGLDINFTCCGCKKEFRLMEGFEL